MLFPSKNSYKLFKQVTAVVLNAPTELGNKASDMYLPTKIFEKFWGPGMADMMALTLNSEYEQA